MNTVITLVRRELLEHRSIFIAPAVLTVIILIGSVWGVVQGLGFSNEITGQLAGLDDADPADVRAALSGLLSAGFLSFWFPFILVMGAVWFFYLLDCLHAERKDRSVLFWRSLPVSDSQTVLSKLATALAAIPLIELAAVLLALVLFYVIVSFGLLALGQNPFTLLWLPTPWLSGIVFLLYGLLTQSLWFAPFAGWLLLVSSAARNAPFLWALGVPAALAYLEYLVLDSRRLLELVGGHFQGWVMTAFRDQNGGFHIDGEDLGDLLRYGADLESPPSLLALLDPAAFVTSPSLWIGLLVTAAFVAGAMRMRRYQDA